MGLASLIGESKRGPGGRESRGRAAVRQIPLDEIRAGSQQPRRHFDQLALEELASSIRANGLIQPVIVRRIEGGYELIAGERRFRAAGLAGLASVPAIVREVDDRAALELALIENLQREDLTPVETARGYQKLMEAFGYSQTEVARQVGKERATVANALRLLRLPDTVLEAIEKGTVTQGHGKALLMLEARPELLLQLFEQVVKEQLNVRQTERAARKLAQAGVQPTAKAVKKAVGATEKKAADILTGILRTRVAVKKKPKGGGQIILSYHSDEELIRLVSVIQGEGEEY